MHNFTLAILEDLGESGTATREYILFREQYYIDILFKNYSHLTLNISPQAGSTKGYKHRAEFGINRTGVLNPMYFRTPEFINMRDRDKTKQNNPMFGKTKSPKTIAKLNRRGRPLIYVYDSSNKNYIGEYSTVNCSKEFKIGKDTLYKILKNGLAYKGKIFSRQKLHF